MAISLGGADFSGIYVGNTEVSEVYSGSNLVWSSSASFVGAVTDSDETSVDNLSFDISGLVSTGRLCVLSITSDKRLDTPNVTVDGMTSTVTALYPFNGSSPGFALYYWFSDASDPTTITLTSTSNDGGGLTGVCSIYRGFTTFENSAQADSYYGMPNPPTLAAGSATQLIVLVGCLDDDAVPVTAPSGYTMSGEISINPPGGDISTTMVAHKLTTANVTENPAAFGGAGNDYWVAFTLRFS